MDTSSYKTEVDNRFEPFRVIVRNYEDFTTIVEFMKGKGYPVSSPFSSPSKSYFYDKDNDYCELVLAKGKNSEQFLFYGIPISEVEYDFDFEELTVSEFIEKYINPPKEAGYMLNVNNDLLRNH